ncbi:hypothetical protein J6590_101098, partial [Homalodisca vitripennis]
LRVAATTAEGVRSKYNRPSIFTTMTVHPSFTRVKYPTPYVLLLLRVAATTAEGGRGKYNRLSIFTTMTVHPSSTRVEYPTPYSAITAEGSSNHC